MGVQSVIFEIIHESLMNKDTELSVSALCEIAGVSRSGYYRWVSAEDARNRREQQDRADFELILTAYNFRGYKKGVLGINMRLLHMGIVMNPKKIRQLMRKPCLRENGRIWLIHGEINKHSMNNWRGNMLLYSRFTAIGYYENDSKPGLRLKQYNERNDREKGGKTCVFWS